MKRTKFPNRNDKVIIRCVNSSGKVLCSMVVNSPVMKVEMKGTIGSIIYNTYSLFGTIQKNTVTQGRANDKEKKLAPFLPLAKQLYDIVKAHRSIKYDGRQLRMWANEFKILHNSNKVSIERMENVLDWYEKNIGGEFVPVVYSGVSFKTKFPRLEDAMTREKNRKPQFEYHYGIKYRRGEDGRLYHARTGTLYIP